MIKQIKIKNFQSHKNTELNLSPGINLILGESTTGKTSVLRALRMLTFNDPKSPIWNSGPITEVAVRTTTDAYQIKKEVNQKTNSVKSTVFTKNDQSFQLSNSEIIQLGLSEINIQSQFEPFFLISKTPGQIGKTIQGITDTGLADELRKNITQEINQTEKQIKAEESNIESAKNRLSELSDLDKIGKNINLWQKTELKYTEKKNLLIKLDNIKTRLIISENKQESIRAELIYLENIESGIERLEKQKTDFIYLIESNSSQIKNINKFNSLEYEICLIENEIKLMIRIEKLYIKSDEIKQCINEKNKKILKINDTIIKRKSKNRIENEIVELTEQYQHEIGDICPYCGNETNNKIGNVL